MAAIAKERVTQVRHWNENLFSFRTTRDPGFRFENGHFVMLGLNVGDRPLLRAYSIASPTGKSTWSSSASRCRTGR